MQNDLFKKKAVYMQIPFISVLVIAGILTFIGPFYLDYFPPISESKEDDKTHQDFYSGYAFGHIDSTQLEIVMAFADIKYLSDKDFKNVDLKIKGKKTFINASLLSIYVSKSEFNENFNLPKEFKEVVISGSESRKKFYSRLKEDRIQNEWIAEDPEDEIVINEVLDLYIKYGNPFKFE